ncbi:MAG: LptF/LptG family permease [Sphingomonadales bacterium]|nr:LptF/LptG family permease [Sphingomonadales bacterium]
MSGWFPRLRRIDIYLLGQVVQAFAITAGLVVAILSLENVSRLWDLVSGTDSRFLLLARLMTALAPEYFGVALPVAAFVAPAWVVRALALRGEWQVFASIGISTRRVMLAPMLLTLLAATAQLAVRMDIEPWGERTLDETALEIRKGTFGTPIAFDEFIVPDRGSVVLISAPRGPGQSIGAVFAQQDDQTFAARDATALRDATGQIFVELHDGQRLVPDGRGGMRVMHFDRYRFVVSPREVAAAHLPLLDELDRMSSGTLAKRARSEVGHARHATASLMARLSSALFILLLPWLALVLGQPPRRKAGGFGLALGIGAIVLFLRTSNLVQTTYTGHPLTAAAVHLALWYGVVAGLCLYSARREAGWIDLAMADAAGRIGRPLRRLALRLLPASAIQLRQAARVSRGPSEA